MNRKDFLQLTSRAAIFFGITPAIVACKEASSSNTETDQIKELLTNRTAKGTAVALATSAIDKVRVGMIGMGNRGGVLIQMFEYLLKNGHAEIVALSDLKEEKVNKNNEYLKTIQNKGADLYFGNENEWKKVAERDDIDL